MAIKRAHGMDISMWQTTFTPPPEKLSDIDFVIMKASESNWKDDQFDVHYADTRGVTARGAYHFFHTSFAEVKIKEQAKIIDKKKSEKTIKQLVVSKKTETQAQPGWQEQADFFINLVAGKDFHFYALDIESGKSVRNIFTKTEVENIKKWIEYVKAKTGKPVLLYTNQNIYKNVLMENGGEILTGLDLWLAGYRDAPNRDEDNPNKLFEIPGVRNWHLWQYSADGNRKAQEYGVGGSHDLDLNVFNGAIEDMLKWLGVEVIPAEKSEDRTAGVDAPGPIGKPPASPAPEESSPSKPDSIAEKVPQVVTEAVELHQFSVRVIVDKSVVQAFKQRDKAGKPLMIPREPRIRLAQGERLSVSTKHTASAKDAGDGIIHATGNKLYYCITDYPADPEAKGFYIKLEDVRPDPIGQSPASPAPEQTSPPKADPIAEKVPQVVTEVVELHQFSVRVIVDKSVVQAFKERDKAGKPLMIPREPRIRLSQGERLSVSTKHTASAKDAGDGIIHATGNKLYYCITDYPADPEAKGFYIKFEDVQRV